MNLNENHTRNNSLAAAFSPIPPIPEDSESECCSSLDNKHLFLCGNKDPFVNHLDTEHSAEEMDRLLKLDVKTKRLSVNWPFLKCLNIEVKEFRDTDELSLTEKFYSMDRKSMRLLNKSNLMLLGVKELLAQNTTLPMSPLQSELFTVMNNYHDIYFSEKNFDNSKEIQFLYCLHSLNHMLKTRSRIIHHNAKLNEASTPDGIVPDTYRDQGLTRPKVLLMLPNRNAAYNVVNTFIHLLQGENSGKFLFSL